MSRGIVRAAAYLPVRSDGRRRTIGPDEDDFTLLATALERAASRTGAVEPPALLTLVGTPVRPEPTALAALLGGPVTVDPASRPGEGLAAALERAASGDGVRWVVAVARDRPGAPSPPPGEGAVAFRVEDGPSRAGFSLPTSAPDRAGPLAWAFSLGRASPLPPGWVGDWAEDPTAGLAATDAGRREEAAPPNVSQGAYVPPPRYEEGWSSRWAFVADRCGACDARTFPRRGRCRACGRSDGLRAEPLPLDGAEVLAVTWIGAGGQPTEFDSQVEAHGTYGVVLAQVAPGIRATLAVADGGANDVRIGGRVDTRLRRLYPIDGAWRYGRKAVPSRGSPAGR